MTINPNDVNEVYIMIQQQVKTAMCLRRGALLVLAQPLCAANKNGPCSATFISRYVYEWPVACRQWRLAVAVDNTGDASHVASVAPDKWTYVNVAKMSKETLSS